MSNSRTHKPTAVIDFRKLHADLALQNFLSEFQPVLVNGTSRFEVVAEAVSALLREYINGEYPKKGGRLDGACTKAYAAFKQIDSPLAQDTQFRGQVVRGMYRALNGTYADAQVLQAYNQRQAGKHLTHRVGESLQPA